jgi:transcriptional regulator with XRE-family HTH domain/predicted negative regulator of RcsB-dependent stress response
VSDTELVPQPHFGERLRRLRLQRGLKQADLAANGLSASYVSRIESGNRAVTTHVAAVLAERLGVDLDAFGSNRDVALARLLADGTSSLAVGNHAAAAAAFEAALDHTTGASLPLAWSVRYGLVTTLGNLGRLTDWRRHAEELVRLATETASPDLLTQAYTGLSNCLRLSGDIGAAYAAARTAHDRSEDPDVSPNHRLLAMIALIAAETEAGRGDDAARRADELLGRLDDGTPGPLRAQALWASASCAVARGRHDEAMELLERAVGSFEPGEDLVTWARLRLAFVSLAQRTGRALDPASLDCFREAAHVLRLTGIPIYAVQLDVLEARTAFEEGRLDRARELCEAALARADLLSFRDLARTQMLWAHATAQTGDPDRALAELRTVAHRLDEAGAHDLSAEAWRLVAELALTDRSARG